MTIVPLGRPVTLSLEGTATVLMLQLNAAELRAGAQANDVDEAMNALRPRIAYPDPVLAYWIYALSGGLLAQDEAIQIIAGRLIEMHCDRRDPVPVARGGLSPARLRRVQDRIDAGLGGQLPLAELATEAGLSLYHFVREFGRTTGMAPHRYVLQRRLGRAITLLGKPDASVAMIAAASGFSDAGHLARHLRRATGMAPGPFRSKILAQR